jgi:hypothetical protein
MQTTTTQVLVTQFLVCKQHQPTNLAIRLFTNQGWVMSEVLSRLGLTTALAHRPFQVFGELTASGVRIVETDKCRDQQEGATTIMMELVGRGGVITIMVKLEDMGGTITPIAKATDPPNTETDR